jgi:multimeric flavodoxin WrbA
MSKNIVILSGSPRPNGNSEKLVTMFKEGAESVGKTVTVFRTAYMKFGGCMGCAHCVENKGSCVIQDGMTEALSAIQQADAVVWASPIYYFSVTGQLKLAIDRMFPLATGCSKRMALLLTCADDESDTAAGALAMYHRTVTYYDWDNAGIIIATNVWNVNDIDGHESLELARKLGQDI